MKNIFDPKAKQEIIARIDKMTPQTKAVWGKMNSTQSLRHMAMAFQIPLDEIRPTVKNVKIPKWLMRFFLLNMKPPKNRAETFPEMNIIKNNITVSDFETEKRNLKNYVDKFDKAGSLIPENAMAGKFTRNDWGKLLYNHTDHHLRQFGN
jgi:hypothetical protein